MRRDDRDDAEETLVTVRVDPQPAGEPRTPPRQVGVGTQMRLLQSAGKSLTPGKYPALVSASPRPKLLSQRSLGASSVGGRSIAHSPGRSRRGSARAFPRWWCVSDRVRRDVIAVIDAAPSQRLLFLAIFTALFLTDVAACVSAPDAADVPIAVVMCACLLVITLEFVANTTCRDNYARSFFFWMDLAGTAAIVADVAWLSGGWLDGTSTVGMGATLRAARAAKYGSRAGKDLAAMIQCVRTFRTFRLFRPHAENAERRYSKGKKERDERGGDAMSSSRMARDLRDAVSKNVAVIVILTVFAAPLLAWNDSDTIPAAYHDSITAVADVVGVGDDRITESVASGFFDFFAGSERKPVALTFGNRTWDWSGTFPRSGRSSDRLVLASGDCGGGVNNTVGACVVTELDIRLVNRWTAFLNIGLTLFVVFELVLVSALLTRVTNRLVVDPLTRVFANIRRNMDRIMGVLESGEKKQSLNFDDSSSDDDVDSMTHFEATIEKMSRLLTHVAGSGAQGSHVFNEYLNDENVDDNTRAWLTDMKGAGGTVNAKPTAPGRPADPEKRKSLGIEIPSPSAIRKKSESAGTTPTRPAVKRSLSFKTMVGMADPSSKYLASDPEAEASSPVDKPTSPPRGISVHNVALEAAAASKRLSNHSNTTDDTDDEDEFTTIRAGPELQMRQKRQRSRARALNAAAALAAAEELAIHLPDVDRDLINTWDFDSLAMTSEEIREHVLLMFGSLGLLRVDCETPTHNSVDSDAAAAEGFCTPLALWNFVARIETGYNDNPYHNFRHAVDVTHTVYRYVTITEPRTHVTHVEKFALLVAALSHDLDHPGVNNAFLVNTKDRLATLYNDSSVLENSHIAFLYDLIATRQTRHAAVATRRPRPGALPRSDTHIGDSNTPRSSPSVCVSSAPGAFPEPGANDEANIFAALDDSLYREVRRIIIATVLHTDMSHHFKMVSQMEVFYELHSEGIAANTRRVKRGIMVDCIYKKEEDCQFLLNVILHAADISNPVKPLDNYGKWSYRVIKEFFEQGDAERELGMTVSPMMDSATVNLAMSQINFIEFVVAPLYAVFGRLFPETSTTLARLVNNRMHYQALLETELDEVPVGTKNRAEDASSRVDGSGIVDGATPPPGAHAGEGKTPEERSRERATTRARFRGMIEKHGIRHGAAGGLLGDSPPFRILMDARTDAPLPPALTLEVDGWLRRRSTDGDGSRRGSAASSNTADGRSRMNSSLSSK